MQRIFPNYRENYLINNLQVIVKVEKHAPLDLWWVLCNGALVASGCSSTNKNKYINYKQIIEVLKKLVVKNR